MRTCLVITCREATRGSGGACKQVVRKYYLFAEEYFATGKWLEAMKLSVARVAREERRRMRAESCEAATASGQGDAGLTSSGRLWTSSTLTPTAHRPDGATKDAKNEEETTTRENEEAEQEENNEPAEQREKEKEKEEENTPEAPAGASSEPGL